MEWNLLTFAIGGEFVLMALIFWLIPRFSSPEIAFGHTVHAAFRESRDYGEALGRYRGRIVWTALICLAVFVLGVSVGWSRSLGVILICVAVLGQAVGFFWAYLGARRRVAPHAVEPSGLRQAALRADEAPRLAGGWVGQLLPWAILIGAGALLALFWERIPDPYVAHWNTQFEPTRTEARSIWGVFGVLTYGLFLLAFLSGLAYAAARRIRRVHLEGPAAQAEEERRRALSRVLLGASFLVAVLFALLALVPFIQTAQAAKLFLVAVIVVAQFGGLGLAIWAVLTFGKVRRVTPTGEAGRPVGDRSRDENWKLGLIYFNRDDPSLFVEQRFGFGYTMNFARPVVWWILGLLLVSPIFLILGDRLFR